MRRTPALIAALVLSLAATGTFVVLGSAKYRVLVAPRAIFEEREVLEVIDPRQPAYESTEVTCPETATTVCPGPALANQTVVLTGNSPDTGQTVKYRLGPVLVGTGDVARATAALNPPSTGAAPQWLVDFQLTPEGSKKFADVTTRLIGKQLAIVVDGRVMSAPTVQEPITGGSGQITGNFTQRRATDVARALATPTMQRRKSWWDLPATIAGLAAIVCVVALVRARRATSEEGSVNAPTSSEDPPPIIES